MSSLNCSAYCSSNFCHGINAANFNQLIAQRRRTGGDRASQIAQTWATILARRELGEGLPAIAEDLEMPYETVKTYVKLARKALISR
jgi:hypothetical protein